jgi:hypothetical protein
MPGGRLVAPRRNGRDFLVGLPTREDVTKQINNGRLGQNRCILTRRDEAVRLLAVPLIRATRMPITFLLVTSRAQRRLGRAEVPSPKPIRQ